MRRLLALALLLSAPVAHAQTDGVLQLDSDLDRFLLRQQAAGRLPMAQLTHRPLAAYQAQAYLDSLAVFDSLAVRGERRGTPLAASDRALLAQFRYRAPLPGARLFDPLPYVYDNGHDAIVGEGDGYALQFNPLFNLSYGVARRTETPRLDPTVPVYQNTRGVQASGHLGRYLFFEARVEENQRVDATFQHAKRTSPRLGDAMVLYSDEANPRTGTRDSLGYDYYRVAGVVGLRTRFVEVRAGRDRNSWGYGRSSLVLSNYAPSYDHVQVRAKVWRIEYTALYAALLNQSELAAPVSDQILPRSYASMHRVNVKLPKGLEFEAFESVMFSDDTTAARRRRGFDVAYVNPLLLLRAAEQDRGSPDNAALGVGLAWQSPWRARFYGTLFLDELDVAVLRTDSWRNKWAFTVGATLADLPVPGLMVRGEYTRIRPFVYSHYNTRNSYTHYLDLLGHPAGPNASDLMLEVDYRPSPRLALAGTVTHTIRGRSSAATDNVGDDPLRNYQLGRTTNDVPTLAGVRVTQTQAEARASVQALPRLWLDALVRAEQVKDAERGTRRFVAPYVSLRWGLPFESARY